MKAFWETVSHDTLRIVRTVSLSMALLLLFATAYLSGLYSSAAMWTGSAMFFAAGLGSLCNAGIASQKLFRASAPHLVFTGVCWIAALYIAFVM